MTKKLTNYIGARVDPQLRKSFIAKAKPFGGTCEVLRELATAFVENRVAIQPPKPSGIYAALSTETKGN